MSRAIVDPEELRRFALTLQHFTQELHHQVTVLQGQFAGLSDTWRDQEHEKFAQQFVQTMQIISQFLGDAGQHVPFLLRKAERIEEYLQQR
ncbi:MAG TPA: WXG100 family type VII secretion target [Gemmataceae bacterium]|nr:WXG100 family type VII secretion target [Gemmataceae bacterium]